MSTFLVFVGVVIFATLASAWAGAVRSASLRRKFEALGRIPGRTMEEIIKHTCEPSSRMKVHVGREVLEWRRINFRVQLSFTAGVCDGVEYDGGA